jgi:diguanylate cyclase (GGDEF)-like protein
MALANPEDPIDKASLTDYLRSFSDRISLSSYLLSERLEDFLRQLIVTKSETHAFRKFCSVISFAQHYFCVREVDVLESRYASLRAQTWFVSELIRGLEDKLDSVESVFGSVVDRLSSVGLRHVYICLMDVPQVYGSSGLVFAPERLYLAAQKSGAELKAFPRDKRPLIDHEHPLSTLQEFGRAEGMMCFSIFSGDTQYGILLCEADREKCAFLHLTCMQLGMLMRFLELGQKERLITEELEDIREKNEILNFLSEYDQLCGLLNRRGFIERAIRRNRENIGKTACCAFIDLDHLKEINDTFGHAEGDCAIRVVGSILKMIVRDEDLIARIGGDEFVGMFLTEDQGFTSSFKEKFRNACDRHNADSGSPYLVQASVGMATFVCQQGMEVSTIIGEADKYLYSAKRNRQKSVIRVKQV